MLTVSFALLLFFIANSLVGAIWLGTRGLWTDAAIFMVLFGLGAVLFFLNAIFLFAASHVEVRIDDEKSVMILPNWRGPTPLFPYTQMEIAHKDIASVETRNEIYRYMGLPVVVNASSFLRKDGKRFLLGYMRESSQDHAVPYREIAAELARRAGVGMVHLGTVDAGSRHSAVLNDEPCWTTGTLEESAVAMLRGKETVAKKSAVAIFIVFVAGGLIFQIARILGA